MTRQYVAPSSSLFIFFPRSDHFEMKIGKFSQLAEQCVELEPVLGWCECELNDRINI